MTTLFLTHTACLGHDPGRSHPERPDRLKAILDRLATPPFGRLERKDAPLADKGEIARIHGADFVDQVLAAIPTAGRNYLDPDTAVSPGSKEAALRAAGACIAAVDAVMTGAVDNAFCAVRPPGHHAEPDHAMGFCLFNNVAIAAEHLVRDRGLSRVAIVDFDAHHGNGTQRIFERRPDVLYISLHEHPASLVFPGTGHAEETGTDAGSGYTVNIPLDRGGKWAQYRHALECQVLPALDRFQPQFLLLSAGFDALMWDGTSHLSLEPECYGPLTQALLQAADRHAEGRVVSVLEGGYDLGQLGEAVAAHVRELVSEATA